MAIIEDTTWPQPRFERRGGMLVAGLSRRFAGDEADGIPELWDEFTPLLGHVPGQIGMARYGILSGHAGAPPLDYIAGVEVGGFIGLPEFFGRVRLPAATYAVFATGPADGPVEEVRRDIWQGWTQTGEHEIAETPGFEYFGGDSGTAEIWIPLKL